MIVKITLIIDAVNSNMSTIQLTLGGQTRFKRQMQREECLYIYESTTVQW